jgi:hypothetical protein
MMARPAAVGDLLGVGIARTIIVACNPFYYVGDYHQRAAAGRCGSGV